MAGKRTARRRHQPPPNPSPNHHRAADPGPPASSGSSSSSSSSSPPPPCNKRMLAFHFLRALTRIHSTTPAPRRTRTIRRAAYSSMARASSPRRAWTQALLGRQARARRAAARSSSRRAVLLRRRISASAPAPRLPGPSAGGGRISLSRGVVFAAAASAASSAGETSLSPATATAAVARGPPPRQAGEPARADALRRLVPGGTEMEYCSLLDETADYVRCLRAQVQLMQGLVDLFSAQ